MAARGGGPPRAPMPIFGWSDRNFRCIIYSRFNEPRKRSKGPRGLFLIIRRTREGRDSRSPFPPLLLSRSPFPSSKLPMLHGFLSFSDSFARLRDLLLDRRYFITGLLGAVLFVSSFFSPSFRWKGG